MSHDVTERKRAEEERDRLLAAEQAARLRASEGQYRSLAEAIPQIVWTARPDGAVDYYNRRWFEYTGMTLEQTGGWGWAPVIHPDDLQRCIDRWTEALRTGEPYENEYPLQTGGGRRLPLAPGPGRARARPGRPDREVVRRLHRHRRPEARRGGVAAGQGGGRGRQPGQERVPGQHEPRDPHADERHPRHDRAGPRHRADARAARVPRAWSSRRPTRC